MDSADLGALLIAGVVALLHSCVVLAALPSAASACSGVFLKWCRRSSEEEDEPAIDRESSLTAHRLAKIRCIYADEVLQSWMHVAAAALVITFCRRLPFEFNSPLIGRSSGEFVTSAIVAASYLLALVVRMWPKMLCERSIWMLHSCFMGLATCYGLSRAIIDGGSKFEYNQPRLLFFNVIIGTTYPEALPNLVWNAVWAAMYVAVQSQAGDAPLGNLMTNVCLVVAMQSLVLWKFQKLQVSLVRSELEAKGHLQIKVTMEKILSNMNDAVVELDRQLSIRRPCPKLCDLLIKNVGSTALQGEEFPGLLFSDVDRDNFEKFMTPRSVPIEQEEFFDGDERASSVFVNLRDGSGTPVCVQLFHSCHHDPPDEVCHILGVREVQEHTVARQVPEQTADAAEATGQETATGPTQVVSENLNDETDTVASSALLDTQGTTIDGNALLAPVIPEERMYDPVSVLLDPVEMKTIACTTGFKSFTGPLIFNGSVQDIIINYSEDFETWIQHEIDGRLFDRQPSKFALKLAPAGAKRRPRFEFKADAYIVHARLDARVSEMGLERADNGEEEEEYPVLCVLALRKVNARWCPQSQSDQGCSSTTPRGLLPQRYGITL